jgi:hypothetical protein
MSRSLDAPFGDVPEHIKKRHARDVPSLGNLDDIVLPTVPVRMDILPSEKSARSAVLDSSAKLDDLTQLALTRLEEILDEPLASDPKEMAVQMDAIRLTLTTQLRVDDSRLKKRENDTLAKLLARLDDEDARLMKVASP